MLKEWEDLPEFMRIPEVKPYWEVLNKKRSQLILKRVFDLSVSLVLFAVLVIPMAVIGILIKKDSEGPVFFRQERVTTYGRHFNIHKFRTMVSDAEETGSAITVENDSRITRIGSNLRKFHLDELPQVIDVIKGDMSFVGTRPEAVKYVENYLPEYNATLLMPAGITSEASIRFKDESQYLDSADDVDAVYMGQILPEKMIWNLQAIKAFSLLQDISTMFRTAAAVFGKEDC